MRSVGVVLTARMGSKRLHEKPMAEIAGKRAIEHQIGFLQRGRWPIVLAVPESPGDDMLAQLGKSLGVEVYRGDSQSPLHRLHAAARKHGFDDVIRVTCDDLMIDARLTEWMVERHQASGVDYTYCWNCPEGVAPEVIRGEHLSYVAESTKHNVEHASYYLKSYDARVEAYNPPDEYRHQAKLTLDSPEDLTVLRILFNSLNPPFGTLDVINFLKQRRNWYIGKINRSPLVTVYTCAHNYAKYLGKCMDSVLSQRGVSSEYIVVDDASSDQTASVALERHSALDHEDRSRVRIIRNACNLGLPGSSNVAISMARGRYVLRVDADDWLLPGALERMSGYLRAVGDAQALFSGYHEATESGELVPGVKDNREEHPGCCLMSTKAAHDVRFREDLAHYEGAEFMGRFKKRYTVAHLADPTWVYRRHASSKTVVPSETRERIRVGLGLAPSLPALAGR